MKKIVITGATSMLGIALINECISHNTEVLAIIRPNSSRFNRLPKSPLITVVECELDQLQQMEFNSQDYEVFFHFAWGYTAKGQRNNPVLQNLNVSYTLDAVKLAKNLGCETFIGAGSQAEYGRVEDVITPRTPVDPENAYGVAKYSASKLSRFLCEELELRHIWVRVFSIYGPNDNDGTLIRYTIESLLNNQTPSFTNCEQVWDYLYCGDAARAFYLIGKKGKDNKVYCLGSGKALQLLDYIHEVAQQIDPNCILGIGLKPYLPGQVMHLCADISDVNEDTGFIPETSFTEGVAQTIRWCREIIK